MNYLVDTNILIWGLSNPSKLSTKSRSILEDGENKIFYSVASIWEIIIKLSIKKLKLDISLNDIVSYPAFHQLNINIQHVLVIKDLPEIHKDPFDRIIIAQSLCEKVPLITSDNTIKKYPIRTIF